MKKTARTVLALLLAALLGSGVAFSALAQDYSPNTPIKYSKISDALFRTVSLSTGSNTYNTNDNWKYYYWCDFTPQYSAEFSATMDAIRPVGVEIYDAAETLLASEVGKTQNENRRYSATASCFMEKGKTYYFKFFFSGGHYDSCGNFNASLKSGGSPDFPGADNLTLYVGGSVFNTEYELPEYSSQAVFSDLSLLAVFADGTFFKWENTESASLSIHGVDIILDMSDCTATFGTHTVRVHYMGYEVAASFKIVECKHNYKETYHLPGWLSREYTRYACTKCGAVYDGDYGISGKEVYAGFDKYLSAYQGGEGSFRFADMNCDGIISLRDYSLLRSLYSAAEKEFISHFAASKGSADYLSEFDLNSDGSINIRDYSLLKQSKPKK